MKKKFLICIIAATVICLGAGLTACSKNQVDKQILDNISEIRTNVYVGANDKVSASIITGKKENPFVIDGISGNNVGFTVISITPFMAAGAPISYSYKLTEGKNVYEGSFKLHPFGESYEADLGKEISADEVTIEIIGVDFEQTLQLSQKHTAEMIDWQEALLIANNELSPSVASLYNGKEFEGEVYVRFYGKDAQGEYFWYVAFVGRDKQVYAALINPLSKQIVAVRNDAEGDNS